MTRQRTLVSAFWSLQRARHGEQPVWLAVVLAAMLGQLGLPGGGFGHGRVGLGTGRTKPAPVTSGRSSADSRPGRASHTAGTDRRDDVKLPKAPAVERQGILSRCQW
jgi:anaerobic selenocysteine-containing dehydrogenase